MPIIKLYLFWELNLCEIELNCYFLKFCALNNSVNNYVQEFFFTSFRILSQLLTHVLTIFLNFLLYMLNVLLPFSNINSQKSLFAIKSAPNKLFYVEFLIKSI